MCVKVNKAWSNNRPIRVDDLFGDTVSSTAYTGDAAILDPHVASESRHPCSVHNGAVFDMNVVVSRHGSPRSGFRSGVVPNQ
tara:strand:- start:253 stop:498 length:246 start_codon:yes stop_codon:yes gene_type:complete